LDYLAARILPQSGLEVMDVEGKRKAEMGGSRR